jgi:hypothetical protein
MAFQMSAHRRILIFGTDRVVVNKQLTSLKSDRVGLDERDIKIQLVQDDSELNLKYNCEKMPFTIILIGKDGGEKLRSATPETAEKIFAIIDQMPMRKTEISERKY